MPKKIVHDVANKTIFAVEMTAEEIADMQAMQDARAAWELLPKPGQDLLDRIAGATKVADLWDVLEELVRRVYGLPAPEPDLAEGALSEDESAP